MKKKRAIYNVHFSKTLKHWRKWVITLRSGKLIGWAIEKPEAISIAVSLARTNQPSQVVIYKEDGRIQSERTYGNDPRRSKG